MASLTLPIHSYRRDTGSTARTVNCFAEQTAVKGKGITSLVRSPGVSTLSTVGNGPIRGGYLWGDYVYLVSGTSLYKVSSDGTSIDVGTIPGTERVDMSANRVAVVVVTGNKGYTYNGAVTAEITDTDFTSRGASQVEFLNNYLLFLEPDTDTLFGAELGSATEFDPLDFAIAEASPDRLKGFIADHEQLVLGGGETTELYWNSGIAGFPFERVPNGTLEIGCGAGNSFVKADNSVYWLDDEGIFRKLDGITPMRVSQHGVEEAVAGYSRIDDCYAFKFTTEGHIQQAFVFPTEGETWVYDATTQEWHERLSTSGQWKVRGSVLAWGKWHVWDDANNFGVLDPSVYAEWGSESRMEWTYPVVYADGHIASHSRLEIFTQRGAGLATGQGSDPVIGLDYSDDGSKTWNALPAKKLGKQGQYRHRSVWYNLGSSRDRVYRAWVSDPVGVKVFDTQLEVEGGRL